MGEGRDVYHEPEDRVLIRTEDVYQTTVDNGIERYSETLLGVVASFQNSGKPEGCNAQGTTGKSKRGQVACRLYARVNPATRVIEEARFKATGCLAMIACSSTVCAQIEGLTLGQALEVSVNDVAAALDGVPAGKANTLYFATEAVRALVGDFLLREGCTLAELDEHVPCNDYSVPCMMCEQCSLRKSRVEQRADEVRAAQEEAERAALAQVFEQARRDSADSKLSPASSWAALVPAHWEPDDLLAAVKAQLDAERKAHPAAQEEQGPRGSEPAAHRRSAYAGRAVGIPRRLASTRAQGMAQAPSPAKDAQQVPVAASAPSSQPATPAPALAVPRGYELRELEGEWTLVEVEEPQDAPAPEVNVEHIVLLQGTHDCYLYDRSIMTDAYARWAFLAAEDDPLVTLVTCAREESRLYPRPMPAASLLNEPFNLDVATVEAAWGQAQGDPRYADIRRTVASNGAVYYYSTDFLSAAQATALAEWNAVGRPMSV